MATRKWDAYRTLKITARGDSSATCSGTKNGKRCRWDIEHRDYEEVVGILNAMELQPPEKAYESLRELAELSLCRNFHQRQAFDVVRKWKSAIEDAAKEYEEVMALRQSVRLLEKKLKNSNIPELEAECERVNSLLVSHIFELELFKKQLQDAVQLSDHRKSMGVKYRRAAVAAEKRTVALQQELATCQSDLERQRDDIAGIREEVSGIKLQLKFRHREYCQQNNELEAIKTAQDALVQEKQTLEFQLEHQQQEYQDLVTELNELKTREARYSMDAETMRTELVSEKKVSTQLEQELAKAKEELSSACLALADAQADLALACTGYEDLSASSADMQKAACTSIINLKDQVDFMRSRPCMFVFLLLREASVGWVKGVLKKVIWLFS